MLNVFLNARGVAIHFKRNLDVLVHQKCVDSEENYIVVDPTANFKRSLRQTSMVLTQINLCYMKIFSKLLIEMEVIYFNGVDIST
jgi:hypothetical protein